MPAVRKIAWRTADGETSTRYQVRYRDAAGKRRARQFARKREADDFANTIVAQVRAGTHTPERDTVTVAAAAEIWLGACERGRDGREPVEASTLRQYRQHVRLHIVPLIGGLKLSQLTAQRVRGFRDEALLKGGRSRAMTKKVLGSLSAICTEAAGRGLMAANPCAGVTIVRSGRQKTTVAIPTKAEVVAVVARSRAWIDDPNARALIPRHRALWFHTLLLFIVSTGVRLSEARGAAIADLDLEKGLYTVAQRADERGRIGAPKSASGHRSLELGAALVAALARWLKVAPKSRLGPQVPAPLLFANGAGRPESMQNIYRRCWHPLLVELGFATRQVDAAGRVTHVTNFGIHDLRHFHASLQIEAGMPAKELQAHMGHASIQMTMDVYGHLFTDVGAQARRRAIVVGAVDGLLAGETKDAAAAPSGAKVDV
jgi:integrase